MNKINNFLNFFSLHLLRRQTFLNLKEFSSRNIRDMRMLYFINLSDSIGDIVEIGVASGRSIAIILFLKDKFSLNNRVIGFDTFEGFPDSTHFDQSNPKLDKRSYEKYTLSYVSDYLKNFGYLNASTINDLTLVQGLVPKSLLGFKFDQISLLHMDCDLYECHLESLIILFKYFVNGTYVLFDDYADDKWPGVKKAVDKFCLDYNQKVEKDVFGFYYIKIVL